MMLRFMVPQEWPAPAEWAAEALRQISAGARGNRRAILNAASSDITLGTRPAWHLFAAPAQQTVRPGYRG